MGLSIGSAVLLTLSGCGGGGGETPAATPGGTNPDTPVVTPKISGKAIDGYLVGATVCLDMNHNNACDSDEPSTTTDAQGNYALVARQDQLGQTLLVQVTPGTKDLSRPGYQFPATFTLSQIVTEDGQQHITPLTTLVAAQMQAGLSQAQATEAVRTALGIADPNADYVAGGNADDLAKAIAVVDKITSFATNGVVDADTVRNTLNAIVEKGDIASVTATDVQAQAAKPVYAGANATTILAAGTYGFAGYLENWSGFTGGAIPRGLVQEVRSLRNGQITTIRQEYTGGGWSSVSADKYETMQGVYALRSDLTWSAFVPVVDYRAPLSVNAVGAKLKGVDAASGISYNYEFRTTDLSGQSLVNVLPASSYYTALSLSQQLQQQKFADGTQALVGLLSYDQDQIVLPSWNLICASPQIVNGLVCDEIPAVKEDGRIQIVTGDATRTYSNVRDVIGQNLTGRYGTFNVSLLADGTIQYQYGRGGPNGIEIITAAGGTWSAYGRSNDVLVLNPNADATRIIGFDPIMGPVQDGAKLVVALRNGHLRLGWLFPAAYAQKNYQFTGGLNAQLFSAVQAATVPR
ncbi:hypothetical protein [Cupriavidus sp. DL-D2]|jgi:hypothetical protein|uniref:hypothetical protein n=1 Tax=Cupriavidus sp. DL-D2 TaxID=3144974 RepID=UPI00321237F2